MSSLPPPGATVTVLPEDRYDRQRLIPWWDQERLARARVLVVGAGALGNEILKLLSLTGVGHIMIYDMDRIELSNLSRTVLFRETDEGAFKAEVAAERVGVLNPHVRAVGRAQNILSEMGQGLFLWADIVICGLDNRLARVFVNSSCARAGRVWIDGAIEGLSGIVRVFDPARTPCYECTMNETDRRLIRERLSCNLLARDAVALGHAPTTAVAASLIAALEVQEAIKYLHGQPTLYGEGIYLNGMWGDYFNRERYQRRDGCLGHERLERIIPLRRGVGDITLGELLSLAETSLGDGVTLELSRDVVTGLTCPACEVTEKRGVALGTLSEKEAKCARCGTHRIVEFTGTVVRDGDVDLALTPSEIGVPPFDIIVARRAHETQEAWLFDGDASLSLGHLADTFDPAQLSAVTSAESVSTHGL
ncbi:MAG TPA: ThiF family adenylyltransferase [Pyrinomonadaceae bacterium]|jgi:adenylyltransferase/sulfurtransferase